MRLFMASLLIVTSLSGCFGTDEASGPESPVPAMSPVPLDADGYSAPLSTGWTYEDMTWDSDLVDFPIQMEVYLPDPATSLPGMELPETFPTILMASPYWGNGNGPDLDFGGYVAYEGLTHRLIQRGYAVVLGDSASMGGSGGCWDFMGPIDVSGSLALVDAIIQQPWSDGKVGMHGLSYDGMTQVMAASHAPEGLITVVPAAALTHAYAGLYQGGIHYGGGWHSTTAAYTQSSLAPRTSQERQGGWLNSIQSTPACADTNAMGNDPTGDYNEYFQARDFRPLGQNVNASVFVTQGFYDAAVKPDNFGEWFDAVPTAKKAWLGWWPHTYPTATGGGRDDLVLTLHRWFDHELKGVPNGILDDPSIDVQDSQGYWRHEDTWPPLDSTARYLNLSGDLTMSEAAVAPAVVTVGAPQSVANQVGGTDPGLRQFRLDLPEGEHFLGVPMLRAAVSSDRAGGYLIARLFDVSGQNDQLLSRGALNLNHGARDGVTGTVTPGEVIDLELLMYPMDARIAAGHELVLELQVQDEDGWYDPDAQQAILTLYLGDNRTTLDLLSIERDPAASFLYGCGSMLGNEQPCYNQDTEDRGVDRRPTHTEG